MKSHPPHNSTSSPNRFQAFFRQRPKRVLFVVVGVIVLVLVAATRWQYSRSISRVNVVGTTLIRQSEIVDLALQAKQGSANTSGNAISSGTVLRTLKSDINTSEIESRIEKHPFVKSASVFIGASDALTVEIQERTPIAYMMMKGKQFYVDAEGRIMPYRLTESVLDLPVIAAIGRTKIDSARIAEVLLILDVVQTFDKEHPKLPALYSSLSEIDVLSSGEFQFRLTSCSTPIRFGTSEQKEEKIARISAFMQHCARSKTSLDDCKYVDVRWQHQVVLMPLSRDVAAK